MALQPLEFADCLTDSPFFRDKLHEHEKELDRTSKAIKSLIQHGGKVLEAAKQLSQAQKQFARDLEQFNFQTINNQQTDDERVIAHSLQEFGSIIKSIEEERQTMLELATQQFVKPLETFRKDNIGGAKEEKKNFDKQTTKYCQSLERYLNMKNKVNETTLQEADASLEMERRGFYQASMKYVLKLHEVQEKKKFEFVEILLGFMYSWLTFYHQGHESFKEFQPFMRDCQQILQKNRENFECAQEQATQMMNKLLEKPVDQNGTIKGFTKQGYLYLMEKKALGTTWTKYYCQYKKETNELYMILYNQLGGKMSPIEKLVLGQCVRRATESIEKRFCFDITVKEKQIQMTFQALSEEDRKSWLDAMDGKEPIYNRPVSKTEESFLDDIGFAFMTKSLAAIENRGLHEQGLYRVVGVNSKVQKLLAVGLDKKKYDKLSFEDPAVWETKTITSAVKNYLRSLPEPLMSFKYHDDFIKAAKQESKNSRVLEIHPLVHKLPERQYEMLDMLVKHLVKVAKESEKNKMTIANLGVCFGPTLMRPEEESMAAIMDIKFCNIVVEILITNYDQIFGGKPEESEAEIPQKVSRVMEGKASPRDRKSSSSSTSSFRHNPNSSIHMMWEQRGATGGQIYLNQAPVHPSAVKRTMHNYTSTPSSYNQTQPNYNSSHSGYENHSLYGSSESLNSPKPNHPIYKVASPKMDVRRKGSNGSNGVPMYSNTSSLINRYNMDASSSSMSSSMNTSIGRDSKPVRRLARALYRCKAENDSELSFEANQLIHNVRPSKEAGWLEGTSCGKTGLLPENYIEYID